MSGKNAARIGDKIDCKTPQTKPPGDPHAPTGVPIVGAGAATVKIGGKPAARMGDFSMCPTPVPIFNNILKGAMPVLIMNMPAAREGDPGTPPHTGSIMGPCCDTVTIGAAGTTGNPRAAKEACEALAAGRDRPPGDPRPPGNQSYNNCGIEASRQLVNKTRAKNGKPPISEDKLMQRAKNNKKVNSPHGPINNPIGQPKSPNIGAEGGTRDYNRAALLKSSGVPNTLVRATPMGAKLAQAELALAQGRGVLASGNVSGLPPSAGYPPGASGGHIVAVTGYDYDENGNIVGVHYNDTNDRCGQRVTADEFQRFLDVQAIDCITTGCTPPGLNVTKDPIW